MRALASEIIYYYNKYGSINVADFYTYIHDKSSLCDLYNEIIAANYIENTTKDDLFLYFKVIREYGKKQEINRLTNLMKKEVDPLEQAKIVEKISKKENEIIQTNNIDMFIIFYYSNNSISYRINPRRILPFWN